MNLADLENRFTYHPPTAEQVGLYQTMRDMGKEMAICIEDCCPDSREKSLAVTKAEEAVMWANAAIARN